MTIARPRLTLKWAQSLDGQLADDEGRSQWISGPEERRYNHQLRSMHDGVLVGAQTFLKDRCQLTVRDIPFAGRQPVRVVADPRGRVAAELKMNPDFLQNDPSLSARRTYVLVEKRALPDTADVVFVECAPACSLAAWLEAALTALASAFLAHEQRPLKALMVEGGPAVLTALLGAGLADAVEISISPLVLGGQKHRVAPGFTMAENFRLQHLSTQSLGQDILLRYQAQSKEMREKNVS